MYPFGKHCSGPLSSQLVIVALLTGFRCAATTHAGEVYLESGGVLRGEVQEISQGEEEGYQVTTRQGMVLQLKRHQVAKVVVESEDPVQAYLERARTTPDTVAAQLALAKWCREQQLKQAATRHAERVLQLDSQHAEARKMLNFRQVDGQWQTREQVMVGRGLVWYEGEYRTRQEMELFQQQQRQEELAFEWASKVKRWHRDLGDRDAEQVRKAVAAFRAVTDPWAAEPIVELLKQEQHPNVRGVLIRAAAQIEHQATVDALVTVSLEDPQEQLRDEALEALVKSVRPGLMLPYLQALKSRDNAVVNRAAVALGMLGDPRAMGPLIDALLTEHRQVRGENTGGGDTYSFSPTTGGFSFGGGGPKIERNQRRNPEVVTALVRLSGGMNFGYAQARWQTWLASQKQLAEVDLRRDR